MSRTESSETPARTTDKPGRFLLALAAFSTMGVAALWQGNKAYAPEMYSRKGAVEIADAFARGRNYSVFDLNINIRELRNEHIKRMTSTPDVAVLGASHWQEAHDWLVQHKRMYNAHVHRDYYEDMLGMVEMFVRHDRLPKQMIIAVRDNLFTPVAQRRDHLWLPGVPYYEAMANRLNITPHSALKTAPYQRWRELASLPMFHINATRWINATFRPRATSEAEHPNLDMLLPGGSIIWSHEHQALFTQKRTLEESNAFARQRVNDPPSIDPVGVEHFDRLLQFLKDKGVEVYLAHPPFNPDYYNQVMKGSYAKGLRRIEQLTQDLADKYGWKVIGGFNPAKVGCESRMFIDAEHGSPECLSKLFNEYAALDIAKGNTKEVGDPLVVSDAHTAGQTIRHRIAVAIATPAMLHNESEIPAPPSADVENDMSLASGDIIIRPRKSADPVSAMSATQQATTPGTTPAPKEKVDRIATELSKRMANKPATKTNRYPFVSRNKVAMATAATCTPYVWPGDHAYPDRLKGVCRARMTRVWGG